MFNNGSVGGDKQLEISNLGRLGQGMILEEPLRHCQGFSGGLLIFAE
jgi:hypothetical protein